jgi:flagellar biogenesis protein FliO
MERTNEMDNETETTFNRISKRLVTTNLLLLVALVLVAALGVKDLINTTKTTKKLSEVAQKVGVEFPTKTNNVLGVWQVVKPK